MVLSKHFLFAKASSRRHQDGFSVTYFCLPRHLLITNASLQNVFKTFPRRLSRRLSRRLQDVFAIHVFLDVSRRLQQDVLQLSIESVLKTSWKTKNVTLRTSSRRLKDVFSRSSPRRSYYRAVQVVFFDYR